MSVTGAILTPGVVFAPRLPVLPRFPLQPEGLFRDGTAGALMDASALALAGRALFYTDAGNTAAGPGENVHTFLDTARARLWSSGAAYGALEGHHATQATTSQQPVLGSAPVEVRNLLADSADFSGWGILGATVTPRPVSGKDADFLAADAKGFERYTGSVIQVVPYGTGLHTVWADLEKGTARYAVIGIDNGSGYKGNAAFDLQTGTVIGFSAHPVIGIIDARVVARTGGGYRCEVVFSRTSTAPKAIRIQSSIGEPIRGGSHGYDTDGDGVSGIYLYRAQLETGDTSTAFQKTDGDHLVIVEAGAPSFNYLRFDTVDDKLPQVMPDGLNGDVMIFGRKGAWIDTGVTIAPGGTLTAINGADSVGTAGIIPVLGDIVGWIALDRPITAWEQAQLLAYYAKRGAGGLYTLGPELVVNGTFDTDLSGWTLTTNATQSGGQALLGNEAYLRQPAIPSGTEGFAVIEWDQVITEGTRTRLRGRNENDSGYVDNVILGSVTISGYATGSGHFRAMVPTEDGYLLSLVTEGANSAQVDNLSVKRLVKS